MFQSVPRISYWQKHSSLNAHGLSGYTTFRELGSNSCVIGYGDACVSLLIDLITKCCHSGSIHVLITLSGAQKHSCVFYLNSTHYKYFYHLLLGYRYLTLNITNCKKFAWRIAGFCHKKTMILAETTCVPSQGHGLNPQGKCSPLLASGVN